MWSSENTSSDENHFPALQNVHRKSVGQKVLTGQQLAVLDPNTQDKRRSSQSKPSSHSALMSKESTRVCVCTPVSVWIDPCQNDSLTESSGTEFSEIALSIGVSPSLLIGSENSDHLDQSCDIVLPHPNESLGSWTAFGDHEENLTQPVYEIADGSYIECDKFVILPSATNVPSKLHTNPTLEDGASQMVTYMSKGPVSHETQGVLTQQRSKPNTEHDDVLLENLDLENVVANVLSPSASHTGKPDLVRPSMVSDSQSEDLLTDEIAGDQFTSEPHVVTSENDTNEIEPCLDAAPEEVSVTDVLSEVTEIIENWNLSTTCNEDCLQNELADDDDVKVEGCPAVEILSTIPPVMNDLRCDPLVSGRSERCLSDTFPIEGSLFTEVEFQDPELSLYKVELYTPEIRDNKCCTPIEGITTDYVLTEKDSTLLADAKWFSPILVMNEAHQSDPNPDQGNVVECTLLSESCPTPRIPNSLRIRDIPLFGKAILQNLTPRMFASPNDAGTAMTPVSTTEGVTWTTPIMLLNKSMNTSGDLMLKENKSAKDNSSETDSVLWKEALREASRDELMNRLEGTLIVVEVLSRQLQGWQQNKVSSKPSEQRECSTQTCVTYTSTEEQHYHNLYLKTLSTLRSEQHNREQEETLYQHLKVATEALTSHKSEASSLIEFAKNLYENTQKDRTDLQRQLSHSRKLLADHISFLQKMSEKLKGNLLQRDEMKTLMEEAIQAKDAANQCLQDLEIHSSAVITQLREDLEYEKQLSESVKEAHEQQRSYNEDLAEFVHRAQYVCSEMEEDRTQLQRQFSQAKELMSRHWHLFEVMKEKTQSALGEYEGTKMERDLAVLENEKVFAQAEQLKLENSRLGSELELLMGQLCTLESKTEQLKEENSELEELLSAKESSMKLLQKELNEATARGRENQDRMKHLSAWVVPRLEENLSDALNQNQALQKQLKMLAKEHASQVAYYTESLEFLEQENIVCREQVAETESQLKTHHLTVLERNYQCENLKDTIRDLQKEVSDLQEKLSHCQEEAQGKITTLCEEMSESSAEVSKIKSHMLELIKNLRETAETKSLPGARTPARSLVQSKNEELTTTNFIEADSIHREGIWSKTSAFTVVLPVIASSTDSRQEHLPDVVRDLSSIVTDVVTTLSNSMEEKHHIIRVFETEILSLKAKLQSQRLHHTSEVRVLQEELDNLKRKYCLLDEKINGKNKCISELQEVVNQQEQKILQQFSEAKKREGLIQESAELQLSLKVCEKEVEVLKQELAQDFPTAARTWIQEKLILHKDLITMREKLVDLDFSKSESIQRLLRHKDILEANLSNSEAEVRKLDVIIERIRQILLSIPDVVDNCDKLRQLKEFLK
ncbi:sperm-associated antigen 5 isoform 2-T2 [Anomaloglossus baeobatrachus]|uniref:sperm-associated antigen 5 isoform X2 n=1 Tax=Anomaloglossus baeobatrachus TaxID=238106 RepID=UPI003F4F78CA